MAVTTQYDVQLEILNKLGSFSEDQLQILNGIFNLSIEQLQLLSNLLNENKNSNLSLDKIIDIISKYKIVEKEVPVEKIIEVPKYIYVPDPASEQKILHLLDKVCEAENECDKWKNAYEALYDKMKCRSKVDLFYSKFL